MSLNSHLYDSTASHSSTVASGAAARIARMPHGAAPFGLSAKI